MASNKHYITAGLPASKDDAVTPTAGVNTVYITAGLPPVATAVAGGGLAVAVVALLIQRQNKRKNSLIGR